MLPLGINVIRYASLTSLDHCGHHSRSRSPSAPRSASVRGQYVVYGVVAAIAVLWALRPNIKRLINGTEPRAPKLDLAILPSNMR